MNILTIHDGHNASACLLREGRLTHLAQEERFVGVKNQSGVPVRAIDWMLADAGLTAADLDRVVLCGWELGHLATRADPLGRGNRKSSDYSALKFRYQEWRNRLLKRWGWYERLKLTRFRGRFAAIENHFASLPRERLGAMDHHLCHAASAYYGSPWAGDGKVLVLTLDGAGDGLCATVSVGEAGRLRTLARTDSGHSLGDLYARVTREMGMKPLEHEYKLMGMAPYAEERYAEEVSKIFASYLEVDGLRFRCRLPEPTQYTHDRIHRDMRWMRFDWVAAGLQLFTERRMLEWIGNCIRETGIKRLALAGGTFMNVKANGLIAQLPEVEDLFVCPSSGDESLPLGAAWLAHLEAGGELPAPLGPLYLGAEIAPADVDAAVAGLDGVTVERPADPPGRVAELLAAGEIVARCAGRCEFGARALGNRSIFADPSRADSVRVLNRAIKMRDFWMPFAPIVKAARHARYLENPKRLAAPYMMLAFPTIPARFEEIVCAVQPADKSARPEILPAGWNPPVEAMLDAFETLTGRAMLLNTSYNIHGEPMVGTAAQGVDVFRRSGLKWLWLGDRLLHKEESP